MATTIVDIPMEPGTGQQFRVALNQYTITIELRWNTVSKCWVMDIYDDAGTTPIVRGIPLITGANLLHQYEYMNFNGDFIVMTIAVGKPAEEVPGFNDIGVDGHLYFLSETP